MSFIIKPLTGIGEENMKCNHPEAFVSIKNGKRVCGICGEIAPEPVKEKPEKKEGKKNAHKGN